MKDFRKLCTQASVFIGEQQLKGFSDSPTVAQGFIGESAMLKISLSNAAGYIVRSLPLQDKTEGTVSEDGKASFRTNTGRFNLELMQNGSSVCTLMPEMILDCKEGFDAEGRGCIPTPHGTQTNLEIVLATAVGIVLALCVGLLLFFIRKHPEGARKLFFSFIRTEVKLALGILSEACACTYTHVPACTLVDTWHTHRFLMKTRLQGISSLRALAASELTLYPQMTFLGWPAFGMARLLWENPKRAFHALDPSSMWARTRHFVDALP